LSGYERALDSALEDLVEHVQISEKGIRELKAKIEECEARRALVQDNFEKYRVGVVQIANKNARRNVLFSAAFCVATIWHCSRFKQTDGSG
jgi:hypothetical protein